MTNFDIVLLTEERYYQPKKINPYIKNIFLEAEILTNFLEEKKLKVTRKDWADNNFSWFDTKCALFKTTWNYFYHFEKFKSWLDKASKQTKLINDISLIKWNFDKHYLLDLQKKGINIPPTIFIENKENRTLEEVFTNNNLVNAVLKPTVSGSGRHTYKISKSNYHKFESIFQELIKNEAMMIQPFQNSISEKGEVSLIVINGKFTHSVLKKAKKGDFRVQDDFGGTVEDYQANSLEIDFAEKAVSCCNKLPLYARVDIFTDNNNRLAISELELIEPELWFRFNQSSAKLLANSIADLF